MRLFRLINLPAQPAIVNGALALALCCVSGLSLVEADPNEPTALPDPLIVKNLSDASVSLGGNFRFQVEATGTEPLSYQWKFNGNPISGATNNQLTLTNIASNDRGLYEVQVENEISSTNSIAALLSVVDFPPRTIYLDGFQRLGSNQSRAQVSLTSNGQEVSVSFSLSFRTDRFNFPQLLPAQNEFSVSSDLSRVNEGLVGFTVSNASGEAFPQGSVVLGDLIFSFAGANNPYEGAVNFTNTPVDLGGNDFLNQSIQASAMVRPHLVNSNSPLVLNPQSGLFEQQITLVNPSGSQFDNVNALIYWPTDTLPTNTVVRLQNSHRNVLSDVTGDGLRESVSLVQSAELAPGAQKLLTLEYYISDRVTQIQPSFELEIQPKLANSVHPAAALVPVLTNRYFNGAFHVEFPTQKGWEYFIEYADTMEDMNSGDVKVAIPSITGSGFRMQWIDNGPPKTETPATPGSRFYRIKELR